jgi:hypothetical protein
MTDFDQQYLTSQLVTNEYGKDWLEATGPEGNKYLLEWLQTGKGTPPHPELLDDFLTNMESKENGELGNQLSELRKTLQPFPSGA